MKIIFPNRITIYLVKFINIIKKLENKNIIIKISRKRIYYIYNDRVVEIYLITRIKNIRKKICVGIYYKNIVNILKGNIYNIEMKLNTKKKYLSLKDKTKKYKNKGFLIKKYIIKREETKVISKAFIDTKIMINISKVSNFKINKDIEGGYLNLKVKERKITYFTYDDYRILVVRTLCSISNTKFEVNIPNLVLEILHRVLTTSDEELLRIEVYKGKVIFTLGDIIIKSSSIIKNTITYKDIIKKEKKYNYIIIKREEIKLAVNTFRKLSNGKDSSFLIKISKNYIYLKFKTSELEQIKYKIGISKNTGRNIKLKLSTEFIRIFLETIKEKNITLGFRDKISKVFLISKGEEEVIYCIMPLS
ncbi:hypothetical protein [Candidatus Vidania fulgoroideorum]